MIPKVSSRMIGAMIANSVSPCDRWLRVYDPVSHQKGWFIAAGWDESHRPALADNGFVSIGQCRDKFMRAGRRLSGDGRRAASLAACSRLRLRAEVW